MWLSIRTQLLSACCLLATASFAVYSGVSPGLAGIAITSSQSIIQSLDYLCSAYGRVSLSLLSGTVERLNCTLCTARAQSKQPRTHHGVLGTSSGTLRRCPTPRKLALGIVTRVDRGRGPRDPVRSLRARERVNAKRAFRYSPELPAVLKAINFTIKPGERVAIAGRTGSGKVRRSWEPRWVG